MAPRDAWLTASEMAPQARVRLFCLPYAGGTAQIFDPWRRALPSEIHICPLQLPGRHSRIRERPLENISSLVMEAVRAISGHLDIPYAIFGHSMGALVGFELARQLRREAKPAPAHLFASGCAAPQRARDQEALHALPDQDLLAELKQLHGTPRECLENAELMELLLPTLRADLAVCESYVYTPEPPLTCPISAFGGVDDPDVTADDVSAWGKQTQSEFVLKMLAGDHFFMHSSQTRLLDDIAGTLTEIQRVTTHGEIQRVAPPKTSRERDVE